MEPIPSEEPLQASVEPKMNRAAMQTHAQVREGRKREGETGGPKTPPKISLLFLWYFFGIQTKGQSAYIGVANQSSRSHLTRVLQPP